MNESEHFKQSEMQCHCGCGECDLDQRLLPALEKLRELAGAPIIVNCAYRCAKHNAEAKGVSKSAHLQGRAADIRIKGKTLAEMYDLAEQVPEFKEGGIGVYDDGFLHVDVRTFPARWARVNGLYVGIKGSGLLKPV
jgi:uncharacterized protein YcbK (DUF882 family)